MEVSEVMAERRSIVDGLKRDSKFKKEELAFVFGEKKVKPAKAKKLKKAKPASKAKRTRKVKEASLPPTPIPDSIIPILPTNLSVHTPIVRVPFSSRIKSEIAAELKRVSLERQLDGLHPSSVQEITELALESWLRAQRRKP